MQIMVVPAKGLGPVFRTILKEEGFLYCKDHDRFEAETSKLKRAKDLGQFLYQKKHNSEIVDGEVCSGSVEVRV